MARCSSEKKSLAITPPAGRRVALRGQGGGVNDARRELNGVDAIRSWVMKEMVGARVTTDVREVVDHDGDTIVRARHDGASGKTYLPGELVISNCFSVGDNKIVSLAVIFTQPSPYTEPA